MYKRTHVVTPDGRLAAAARPAPAWTAPPRPASPWRRFLDHAVNPLADLDLGTLHFDLADIEADLTERGGRRRGRRSYAAPSPLR